MFVNNVARKAMIDEAFGYNKTHQALIFAGEASTYAQTLVAVDKKCYYVIQNILSPTTGSFGDTLRQVVRQDLSYET